MRYLLLLSFICFSNPVFAFCLLNNMGLTDCEENNDRLLSSKRKVYRDSYGQQIGSADMQDLGNVVYRDEYGHMKGSSETNSFGQTVYRDEYGHMKGSSETNSFGQTIYRDEYGNMKGSTSGFPY